MAANNVNVMVKEAIRALKANNKAEARALLEKATELDPYSEQAWLWLSGVVELEDDQRTCLQNVIFINPGNENARQGLAMLEARAAANRPKTEPKPSNVQAFADFDLPAGDDWMAELDEMRQSATSMPTTNPFNVSIEEFDDTGSDPFADPFSDPFGASVDGPFSASVSMPVVPTPSQPAAPITARPGDLDDLDSLFEETPASPSAPASPAPQKAERAPKREKPKAAPKPDPYAHIADDADAGTLFAIIPREIKVGALPGTPGKAPIAVRLMFAALILGNVIAIAMIFSKVTVP